MAEQTARTGTIRFADFEVDIESGELRRGDTRIILQEQPRRILALMLSRPGQLITREELRQQIWGDQTFVDFEHGLNAAIKRLRDNLGDSAEEPRFIETMPRRGYRFIAAIERPPEPEPPPAPEPPPPSPWPLRLAAVAIILLAILGAAYLPDLERLWGVGASRDMAWGEPGTMATVAASPDAEHDSRISPDGQWLSFIARRGVEGRIWIRSIRDAVPRPVSTAGGLITSHAWSTSGDQIAYVLTRGTERIVQVVPAFSAGVARDITTVQGPTRMIGWHADHLFLELSQSRLARVEIASGQLTDVSAAWPDWPQPRSAYDVSEDGHYAVFAAPQDGQRDLWKADLTTGEVQRLTNDAFFETYPVWGEDATAVFYQSNRSGQLDLWRLATAGGETTQVTISAEDEIPEDVSRDGAFLTFRRGGWTAELWTFDPQSRAATKLTAGLWDFWPSRSADGKRLAFQRRKASLDGASRYFDTDVLTASLDDTGARVETPLGPGYLPRMSPDGRWIAFAQRSPHPPAYASLVVANVESRSLVTVTERFAFTGTLEPPIDVIGQSMLWTPASDRLLFAEWTPSKVVQIRSFSVLDRSGAWQTLATAPQPLRDFALSPEGSVLDYTSRGKGTYERRRLDLATGKETVLFTDQPGPAGYFFVAGTSNEAGLIVLRGTKANADGSQPLEVLQISRDGRARSVASLAEAFGQTARLSGVRGPDATVYLTMTRDQVHNIYAVRVADGQIRQVTDNGRTNVSYSGIDVLPSGTVVYVRHENVEDVVSVVVKREGQSFTERRP
jgi:Tol biopolymer transport system component/DNA-binding winged helix-turn-helix (wHTH) protein